MKHNINISKKRCILNLEIKIVYSIYSINYGYFTLKNCF